MNENEGQIIITFIDEIMKDHKIEKPSSDFTAKVMDQILTKKATEIYTYRPLISKSVLAFLFICFTIIFISFYLNGEVRSVGWSSHLVSIIRDTNYTSILSKFSEITIFSVLFSILLLLIQIVFLKKHFEKKLEG